MADVLETFSVITRYTPNGTSVVDYTMVSESILDKVLYLHVSDVLATISVVIANCLGVS